MKTQLNAFKLLLLAVLGMSLGACSSDDEAMVTTQTTTSESAVVPAPASATVTETQTIRSY